MSQLVGAEAIEKKMRDDQVVGFVGWHPVQDVGLGEFHANCSRFAARQPATGFGQHSFTRINASNPCVWKPAATLDQATTMAFAQEQNTPGARNFIEERRAATLEFFSREHEFHPAVMRREEIKTHGLEKVAAEIPDATAG
jgi:hypothetical protein